MLVRSAEEFIWAIGVCQRPDMLAIWGHVCEENCKLRSNSGGGAKIASTRSAVRLLRRFLAMRQQETLSLGDAGALPVWCTDGIAQNALSFAVREVLH